MKVLRLLLYTIRDWIGWETLSEINQRHQDIMAKLNELSTVLEPVVTALTEAAASLEKASAEIIAALGNVEIPPEATAQLEALGHLATTIKTAAKALDDLNPDTPQNPETPA